MNSIFSKQFKYGLLILLLALTICNLTVWSNAESQTSTPAVSFSPDTRVMLFNPTAGYWMIAKFGQTQPGNEFYFNNQLYRTTEPTKAQVVMKVDTGKLFEADRSHDVNNRRRPTSGDVVQVLNQDFQFTSHALFEAVPVGSTVRFQGIAFSINEDRSLVNTGKVFSSSTSPLQRIELTKSGMQHVLDRHTVTGSMNAGKSIFSTRENIQNLIKNAEITAPVLEDNGYLKRAFDAGRMIGVVNQNGKQTSTVRVITTQSGKLVTAYPVGDWQEK